MEIYGLGSIRCWMHQGIGLTLTDPNGQTAALSITAGFTPNFLVDGLVGREFFFETFVVTIDEVDGSIQLQLREDSPHVLNPNDVPVYKPPLRKKDWRKGHR